MYSPSFPALTRNLAGDPEKKKKEGREGACYSAVEQCEMKATEVVTENVKRERAKHVCVLMY